MLSLATVFFAIITMNFIFDVGCLPLTTDYLGKDQINGFWNSTAPLRLARSNSNSSNELAIQMTTGATRLNDITAAIVVTTERPFHPMNHKEALLNHKQQCIEMMNRTYTNQEGESSVQHLEMLHSIPEDKHPEGREQANTLHPSRHCFPLTTKVHINRLPPITFNSMSMTRDIRSIIDWVNHVKL